MHYELPDSGDFSLGHLSEFADKLSYNISTFLFFSAIRSYLSFAKVPKIHTRVQTWVTFAIFFFLETHGASCEKIIFDFGFQIQ